MMSGAKKRVPKRRFKEFLSAGDWKQRKLSDISTKVTTKNVDVHYTETLTNSAEQGIISQVDFFDKEISNKNNINGYYIVENNDFIYNPRISTLAPVGPINRNKLNRTGIMSPLYTVFRASNIDLDFLEWYFQSNHWYRYMKLNGDSGARADRIAIKDSTFFDMPIKTPVNIKEQVLIGETLEKFNQYITLHQRKLDKLQATKKALLQEMFPEEGQDKPKRRFKGFTDAWEQRKLGDFYTFKNGLNKEKVYFGYGDSIVNFTDVFHNRQIYSSTLKGKVFVNKKELENFKVKEGDLFFTRTSETIDEIGFPAVVMEPMERVVFSGFVLRGRAEKNDPLVNIFKSYIFFTDNFRSEMKKKSSMTTRALTSGTALKEMYFSYPKDLEEQTKIGEILLRLDNVITLHQRKLDKLKNLKQAYLNEMFV